MFLFLLEAARAEVAQTITSAEEVLLKGTLLATTTTAIVRLVVIDVLETVHRLRDEKQRHLAHKAQAHKGQPHE